MTGSEPLRGCGEIDFDTVGAIGLLLTYTWSCPHYSIADIDTAPVRIDIAESANQIKEWSITTHVKNETHRPDDVEIGR
jgi:hypothetical protein